MKILNNPKKSKVSKKIKNSESEADDYSESDSDDNDKDFHHPPPTEKLKWSKLEIQTLKQE